MVRELEIHWINASSEPSELVHAALEELRTQLKHYPRLPTLKFVKLPFELDEFADYASALVPGGVLEERFDDFGQYRIFAYCEGDEHYVRAFQADNPLALSGVALLGSLALAWVPNKYLIWHEVLHLLNAKDCYNKFGIDRCPEKFCLMQRGPTRETCNARVYLCSKNQRRIENYAKAS